MNAPLSLLSLLPVVWLNVWLNVCVNLCTAQNQEPRGEQTPASLLPTGANGQVPLEALKPLIAELDTLFEKGDIQAYLGHFTPDHDGAIAMLGEHLKRLCAMTGADRKRHSKIIAGPLNYQQRTVVRLRHVVTWPALAAAGSTTTGSSATGSSATGSSATGSSATGTPQQHIEDTYLAVYADASGKIVPTFAIEMPPAMHCVSDDKFRCPPCNYEIGGVNGFLCVPLRREQGLALESASFYLIGSDVVCDVHVAVPNEPASAKVVCRTLAEAFAKIEPSARVSLPSPWLPPMHTAAPPLGMDSARLAVELPLDHATRGGDVTIFHVVSFGGVQHVLMVRASKQSLHSQQPAIDMLLQSYMLLEQECGGAEMATRPLRQHTGGLFVGSTYHNERYQLELTGPLDWQPEHRVGGSAFRVHWSGPNGSQLWLIGQQVPAGMAAWTTETADRWLSYQCEKLKLVPELATDKQPSLSSQAAWHEGPNGAQCRTLTLRQSGTSNPVQPPRRVLSLQLHPDLLLIVDGFGGTDQQEAAVRTAIATLKRK